MSGAAMPGPTDGDDDFLLSAESGTTPDPSALKRGDRVAGHEVEEEIGRGGMARVYRVRHLELGTLRALKVVQVTGPTLLDRVKREGRTMAALSHPGIVRVLDILELRGLPALLLELVEGPSLDRWIQNNRPEPAEAVRLFRGIVDAVAAAHAAGFVHRDLKPGNVLLAPGGIPRVTDFGLAKSLDDGEKSATRTGATLGTLAYMAPEQIRDASRVDARADVFALGCILYELVCGRSPFSAADPIAMYDQVARRAWLPPEVVTPGLQPELCRLIADMLEPERDRRPADAAVVAKRLEALDDPRPTSVRPLPQRSTPPRPAPTVRWRWLAAMALVGWFVPFFGLSTRLETLSGLWLVGLLRGPQKGG